MPGRHFWKSLGHDGHPRWGRPGILPLEFQVCGLSNVSEEFLKKEEMWKKSRRKLVGEIQTETRVGERESPTGAGVDGVKAVWGGGGVGGTLPAPTVNSVGTVSILLVPQV